MWGNIMKKRFTALLLISHLLVLSNISAAQTAVQPGNSSASFVTFTFPAPCEECSTQTSASGNTYIVDVPSGNTPSLAKSASLQDLNIQMTLKNDRLVYSFSFQPSTPPRAVWRRGGTVIQIFFVPVGNVAVTPTTEMSPGVATPVSSSAALVNPNPGGKGSLSASVTDTMTVSPPKSMAPVPAQTPTTELTPIDRDENTTAVAAVDLSVPESPAFTVLGVTPQTVIRPTSPRAFATSLLNGVDNNGNFQSGLALDFVPYLLLAGDDLTLNKYQTQRVARLLARTQFSFGTTKGASDDDKSLRLALGLHMTLWDRGDPRLDEGLMGCLGTSMKLPPLPTQLECDDTVQSPTEFAECKARFQAANDERTRQIQEVIAFNNSVSTRCREEAQEDNWNRSSWIIGAAPSWISQDGQTKNLHWNGGGFWTSLAYGFEGVPGLEDRSQLILHGRYRNREQVPDPDNTGEFLTQDSFFFGARFRHGSPNFNGSFEYTFLRSRELGLKFDNSSRLSLGFERRIAGDTWFNLSLGGETGRSDGRNNGFVLTSFKWAFSDRKNVSQ